MWDPRVNEEQELKNLCHSASKFIFRYVLLAVILLVIFFAMCYTHQLDDSFYYLHKILGLGLCISRGTAECINITVVLVILPVCKTFNKLIHKCLSRISEQLLASYLENLKVIHQCLAVTLVFTSVIHAVAQIMNAFSFIHNYDEKYPEINWARDANDNIFRLIFLTPVGFSGWTMVACLVVIWTFSTRQMRVYFYNSFLGVHHLFLLFLCMMYYHPVSNIFKRQDNVKVSPLECDFIEKVNTSLKYHCNERPTFTAGQKNFWIWPTVTLSIYLCDSIYRYFRRFFTQVKTVSMELPSKNAIFLTFRINENITIRPGQYILLQCENLSTLEWHPFFITDFVIEPKKTTLTLAISIRGDWTAELYQKINKLKIYSEKSKKRKSRSRRRSRPPRRLIFVLDGPFPSSMESIVSRKIAVLIGSGIGVTPFISILNYIMKTTKALALKRIHFVWISRDIEEFALFSKTLCDVTQMFWNDNQPDRLQVRFYLTESRSSIFDDDEESMRSPHDMFGKNTDFVMSRMYWGKPQWEKLFDYWVTLYHHQPICIYTCGPIKLTKEIRLFCSRYREKGFNFSHMHENFN